MAEFLVYNTVHWKVAAGQVLAADLQKFHQKGDIVEVREDGFFTGSKARGFNKKAFRLVRVPGMTVDNKYMESETAEVEGETMPDGSPKMDTIRRRRYSIENVLAKDVTVLSPIALSLKDKSVKIVEQL